MNPVATNWRLLTTETVPSTSDLCIARAAAGEPAGFAVLAKHQTAGRGSRGRNWVSPPGNLYLSVLLRPGTPAARAGLWSLLGAVALHDALAPFAPGLSVKWPNDVMREGKKLAGILLDSAVGTNGCLEWLVIGFGANLASAPDGAARADADPALVAQAVLARIDHYMAGNAVRHAWLDAAHPIGTALRFMHGGQEFSGSFAGISEDGALQLLAEGEIRTFSTGEVLQGRPGLCPGPA